MAGAPAKVSRKNGSPEARPTASALDRRFDLSRRAREDGKRNLPRTDAQELSLPERQALDILAAERAAVLRMRETARAEHERRLKALSPSPADFSATALEAGQAVRQVEGRLAHDLHAAAAKARAAEADLEAFKRRHDLRRSAVYPDAPAWAAGLLLTAALAEALFSAALFAEDDARGLLGGAVTAVGLSGANVTLGFLAGFLGLRYVQHRRAPMKIAGGAAFAALAFLALTLNLFAADWRDRLAAAAERLQPVRSDASFHLWSLFDLEAPQALILLMLGAGVWVFSALKGYSGVDDPYPDFGKMARAARDAEEESSDLRAEARLALEAPIDEARAALAARLEKARAEYEAARLDYDRAAEALARFDHDLAALEATAEDALRLYREANLAARTAQAPAYFAAPAPLGMAPGDALAGCGALLDAARASYEAAQRDHALALGEIGAALEAASARLAAPQGVATGL